MDLLEDSMKVGFFPLVFAVNAIVLTSSHTNSTNHEQQSQKLFDTFLNAITSSTLEDTTTDASSTNPADVVVVGSDRSRRTISLFRSDENHDQDTDDNNNDNNAYDINADDSSIDDDFIESGGGGGGGNSTNYKSTSRRGGGGGSTFTPAAFVVNTLRNATLTDGKVAKNHATSTTSSSYNYARVLDDQTVGFFQCARVVSVSSRYGFPPSKDPTGTNNIAYALPSTIQHVTSLIQQQQQQQARRRSLLSNSSHHNNNNNNNNNNNTNNTNNNIPNLQSSSLSSSTTASTTASSSSPLSSSTATTSSGGNHPSDERSQLFVTMFQEYKSAIHGILPSGWFDKHVHALPSVILVVCTVGGNRKMQQQQDEYLYETIDHLQCSLVLKRKCTILIVAIVQNDINPQQAEGWHNAVLNEITSRSTNLYNNTEEMNKGTALSAPTTGTDLPPLSILLLRESSDLPAASSTSTTTTSSKCSPALKKLHRATRDASLYYYLHQARRTREKLSKLLNANEEVGNTNTSNSLLARRSTATPKVRPLSIPAMGLSPAIIRYCIKIVIFYEFQITKNEKTILFLNAAYRYIVKYYLWLTTTSLLDTEDIIDDETSSPGQKQNRSTFTENFTNYGSRHGTSPTNPDSIRRDADNTTSGEGFEVEFNHVDANRTVHRIRNSNSSNSSGLSDNKFYWSHILHKIQQQSYSHRDDMIHQCRALGNWLNFKLIEMGLSSQTDHGLMAAYSQWRQHVRTFCVPTNSLHNVTLNNKYPFVEHTTKMSRWYEWLYITRQRMTMGELLEKYPPKSISQLWGTHQTGTTYEDSLEMGGMDEVFYLCSPWSTFVSATEAMLRLSFELDRQQSMNQCTETTIESNDPYYNEMVPSLVHEKNRTTGGIITKLDAMRFKYIGGLATDTVAYEFQEESKINYREKALEYIQKASRLFESELESEKKGFYAEDEFKERCSSRTGARIYYLVGGILLGLNRHEEAASHLIKAAKYAKGWRELELAIRRMLIECYEEHIPSDTNDESNESSATLVSMILDSYFNAEMSSIDLRRALSHFASISGGETLKWYHATTGEDNSIDLPFSFAVTFPGRTHGITGDTVQASVMIKSNLDYAVHINSISLKTLAGKVGISTNDLLSASNASEGTDGGIIIQAQTAIIVSTQFILPRDLTKIASDDTGNGGEKQGIAGKGSFAKSARPRSAGITAAGGARLVSQDKLAPGNRNSQGWNLRYLGGKPLLCDGLHVVFYPVQAEMSSGSSEKVTLIELTIEKKPSRTAANIKRTPFEEENYVASAWSRPPNLPLSRGPRSIRVLAPQPLLVVTNVTEETAKGKALEGTVNRILLKLQASSQEQCSNFRISVSCFSVLVTPSGTIKRLVSEEALKVETENSCSMNKQCFRTPAIVLPCTDAKATESIYGYECPAGWEIAGTGQGHNYSYTTPLREGESSFLHVDFFRPATVSSTQTTLYSVDDNMDDDIVADYSLCKTDYYITVTYQQQRPTALKQKLSRRPTRRRPQMNKGTTESGTRESSEEFKDEMQDLDSTDTDDVSVEVTGTLVWSSPLSIAYKPRAQSGYPTGKLRPPTMIQKGLINDNGMGDFLIHDGGQITNQCTLQLDPYMEGLKTEIVSVRFEDNAKDEALVNFSLLSNDSSIGDNGIIYKSTEDDPCRVLEAGSKLGVTYSVRATVRSENSGQSLLSNLGNLLVDWVPSTLQLPDDHDASDCSMLAGINAHGPLALDTPSTIRFHGPMCQVSSVPFQAEQLIMDSELSVDRPFQVKYRIQNKTGIHQVLHVMLGDATLSDASNGLLITGMTFGDLYLSPFEVHVLTYHVIPTIPGNIELPVLLLSSGRYSTFALRTGTVSNRIFVLP